MTKKIGNGPLIRDYVDTFKEKNPNVKIPQAFNDAIDEIECQNTIFEKGANESFKKWRNFTEGYYAQKLAGVKFDNVNDMNNTLHKYMNWQKNADELLTDAEKTKYTVQNFKKYKRVNIIKFLRTYRKNKKDGTQKGIVKSFNEYKAMLNNGSYRYFLKKEYKNAADNVLIPLKNAEKVARSIDSDLYTSVKNVTNRFQIRTIKRAKITKRNVFGKSAAKVQKPALICGLAAVALLSVCAYFKHITDKTISKNGFAENNTPEPTDDNRSVEYVPTEKENTVASSTTGNTLPEKTNTNNETKPEKVNVISKPESTNNSQVKDENIEERRRLFNIAVDNARTEINVDSIASESYTIIKGDSLWKIAKMTLVKEGVENPTSNEIIKRIALIALLNEQIDKVTEYTLIPGKSLKVPNKETIAYLETNLAYNKLLSTLANIYA